MLEPADASAVCVAKFAGKVAEVVMIAVVGARSPELVGRELEADECSETDHFEILVMSMGSESVSIVQYQYAALKCTIVLTKMVRRYQGCGR